MVEMILIALLCLGLIAFIVYANIVDQRERRKLTPQQRRQLRDEDRREMQIW